MSALLFLCQRLPYPPDKGEKIRYFHFLRHLARTWDVYLGCFIDDPTDWERVEELRPMVRDMRTVGQDPRLAKLLCTRGVATGDPLSVTYFKSRRLSEWVDRVLTTVKPDMALIGSSSMGQYMLDLPAERRPPCVVTDFVDVDSEKWGAYAKKAALPMRLVYEREQRTLLRYDRELGAISDAALFVTRAEVGLFGGLAPEIAGRLVPVENGVDAGYFHPANAGTSPHGQGTAPVYVFTGHMDYWPNIDAVTYFAQDVLPLIRRTLPEARFCIVGARPTPDVQALGQLPGVTVTGRVPDVRPYVAHATACVAPLRIARGMQNKVLEAMACARPVIVSREALEGIDCVPGRDLLLGPDAATLAEGCVAVAQDRGRANSLGAAARELVLARYSWESKMATLDGVLARALAAKARAMPDGGPPPAV